MTMKAILKHKEIFSSAIFYLAILIFIIGFNFSDNRAGGWTQQFMPDLGGRQITDITFLDSLTGYATARIASDTNYVLKTTNGGDNWSIILREYSYLNRVQFLNQNTGYVCGAFLKKTTNAGLNWFNVNVSGIVAENMYVLNQDTIWLTDADGFVGGVFRTTNGGASWVQQPAPNSDHIYMYNRNIGFISTPSPYRIYKTTNSGDSWNLLVNSRFNDIYFVDSLTGWRAYGTMIKTTDGGLNWISQILPSGGTIITSGVNKFSNVNRDTIWAVGGYANTGFGARGIIYRTINSGNNWLFQIPDSNINIFQYYHNKFISRNTGWAYAPLTGIHTTTGGDTIFYTGIQHIQNAVPEKFILKQNYPNPFNPRTVIPYSLSSSAHVKIIAYDIQGREVQRMVDSYHQAGTYEVDFMGKFTSTGVYLYRMTVTDNKSNQVYTDTKKMILLK
jgi:photosystem II stability/assembly factor-like uncharacterized protein